MTGRPVVLERRGAVARIVLDRPERRNALGRDTLPALHAVLDEVERDTAIGAVIVTGRGPVFCAGGDVDEIMSTEPTDREREFEMIRGYNRVVWRLHHLDPPVLAAVNGPAAGGGAALAMACDIAIAAESARYDFVFGRIGLASADMGCTYLLPRLIGRVRASHLVLTGGSVSAREGLALGVFAEVVADDRLQEAALSVAERIAAGSRRANVISKLALRRAEHVEFGTDLEYEAYLQSFAFRTQEHKCRLGAFRAARRRPKP
ncbi:MAG: enoyl-CoA hydratase/isomerase family protein [Candidatus Rokubacteria bacterium]|nr:enoyl-CoA hydratase/isomerase family protein [Candidatus Rokubacteria bacterium]